MLALALIASAVVQPGGVETWPFCLGSRVAIALGG